MRQVILNFHGIGPPARTLETGEAPYWITQDFFENVLDRVHFHKSAVDTKITFDDGNLSDATIAAPALERRGIKATIFVLADRIGQPGSLGISDIQQLCADGHSIGTHGAAHVDWSSLDTTRLAHEIGPLTRQKIADVASADITEAAIPFGRYNATVLKALKKEGYQRVYSSDGGAWHAGQWPVPRTSPRVDMTIDTIEDILLGREAPLRRVRRFVARSIKSRI